MTQDDHLRLVIVGHVDHGKSTLVGRLLHDTGSLPDGKYEQLVAAAARRGVPFEIGHVTDALEAERDQNVTIETSQIWFRTPRRQYVLIDAPGHKEFVRNMVTGAAAADAALVVIDAQEGIQEQSRRHGYLLTLLGVGQMAVVVNKMDLVAYSASVFERISSEYCAFLARLGVASRATVPVSARLGDNVAAKGTHMPWYHGPSIIELLDSFPAPASSASGPLRIAVQDVYRFDHRRILAGRVESGTLRTGDRLIFLPSGKTAAVRTIERWNAPVGDTASAGDSIGLTLTEPLFLGRGEVAASEGDAPVLTREFSARVFWLGHRPLTMNRRYRIKLATQELDGEVVEIVRAVDASTLAPCRASAQLDANQVGEVTIRTLRPMAVDPFTCVPHFGRFVIVDGMQLSGGGVVVQPGEATSEVAAGNITRALGQVSREARHSRNGHKGAVVWLTGLSGAGKSTLATALEQTLFDRGWQAFVLDGDNVRFGLNADLGFSVRDRAENIRRVAEVAKLFAELGVITITAFISPYRSDRARARRVMQLEGLDIPFVEIYLSTPLEVCESRDPKQLYKRARAGEIPEFTGISAPFEPPEHPELTIDTSACGVDDAVTTVLDCLAPVVAL